MYQDMRGVAVSGEHGSPTYLAILDSSGDLFTTIADMAVTEQALTWKHVRAFIMDS